MSHELHNLVTKIENACDPEFYEVADTEHLVRLAVAEYVVAQNGLVASARIVEPTSVQKVIDRHIRENISASNPQTWFANVATKIADFLELAYEGTTNNESADYVDLLPIGHPRNIKNLGLTASARMQAVAEWVAADPRITSDLGRQAVYSAYSVKPGSVEATYANAKIEALAASGVIPADFAYEAIVASFKNMTFAERSARSKALAAVRRRDRRKRFANEFGRLRGFFSKGDGTMFSATGKIAGAVPGENKYYVEYDGSDPEIPKGLYIQDASKSENVKALLSTRALKNAPNLRKPVSEFDKFDQDSAVSLEEFLATKVDAPSGWTKNKDGSFTSETGNTIKEVTSLPDGDYYFEGAGENNEQDLGETLFEIRDSSGELVGVAQDWNGIQKIALTHDKMKEKESKKAPEVNDATVAEALDGLENEANWDDPDGVPSYDSPNGILSVSFNEDGDTDGEGGMRDASFWSATLDPDGEDIDLGTWGGSPDDDSGDIAERVSKAYEEYKAKKAGEAAPAEPEAEAPAKPEVKQTEKSKPSYLDQKPKNQQATLKKYRGGYISDGNQDINVDITDNKDGTYTVDHGYTFLADENAEEIQFDDGAKTFNSEKEALDFAKEKLAYYNSRRVDEDAANDAFDRQLDSAPERGLGQDVPEEAPAKPVKPLSEKQMEPASPKQYALLKEFQEERDGIDENQNQAINDALEKQNLSKAQMASLFGDLQKKPFKPEIDPTRPSDRMINSLRDYLTNKELTPDEINSALDELEAGLDRAGVEKLLAKLRRRPDKAKEDGLGQSVPSDVAAFVTPQGLANGFWFDKSKDGKTWSAEGDDNLVEVTEHNGKWFTTERSGGNGESGFTRESEKQHATAQEAFEYAAEVAGHSWDQDLYDDLNNDFGDDEDEIGFAEEEGLGQELPTAGAPDLSNIDADESWTVDTYDDGNPFGTPEEMINTASYTSPDGRVKAEANYDTDGESQGLYLSVELDGKDLELTKDEYSLSTLADLGDIINAVESAIKRETSAPEQGLGQQADSTEEAPSVDLSNYEKKDTIFDRLIPGDLIPEYYPIRGTEDWLLRNRAEDPNFELPPTDEIIARYKTNNPKKMAFKVRSLKTGKERIFEVTRAARIYDIQRLPVKAQEQGLGQAAPSTKMAEDATDAQYNYISSMLNGKEVPEELATAAKQAIEDRNLSKAQVGEIIGKMRDLPNKEGFDPNAPTERMVESVKRNIVAKGLSKEDQDAILAELPNMDKATMSELIGRLKAMDDVNAPEQGLSQKADAGPFYESDKLSALQDRINALKGEEGLSQFILDDEYSSVDLNNVDDAYQLAIDLHQAYYKMEPTSDEGKQLEADLKQASEDILRNLDSKLGAIEAARYDTADGTTSALDNSIDEISDFLDYYYPSDSDKIAEELDTSSTVGDLRGGGWEGSVRENEDGTFTATVSSPERTSDDSTETFDTRSEAADWVAANLSENNAYAPDATIRTLKEGGIEALVEKYGNDPLLLASKLDEAVNWLNSTNRGQGSSISRSLAEYADRIRQIDKSNNEGLGQESPKA